MQGMDTTIANGDLEEADRLGGDGVTERRRELGRDGDATACRHGCLREKREVWSISCVYADEERGDEECRTPRSLERAAVLDARRSAERTGESWAVIGWRLPL